MKMILEKVYDELISQIEDLKKAVAAMSGATDDYDDLSNRPKVNNITLTGNKKSSDLKIAYSMTEAEYAAASKNAESVYCLQENATTFEEEDETASSYIEWSAGDPSGYVATWEYTPSNQNFTGCTAVECDDPAITVEEFMVVEGSVQVYLSCDDTTQIGETVTFTYTLTQPAGHTRIVKNGVPIGSTPSYTKLWDYKTDNDNAVLYGATLSATLHDAAENYDVLILNLMCVSSDESDATWKGSAQCHVDMHALAESFQAGHIIYQSNSDRASHFYIHGTSLQKLAQAPTQYASTTNGLVNVIGIKY